MSNRLYVGNLSYDTTSDALRTFFEAVGEVKSAEVIIDRETQRSKGFGFVEMATAEQTRTALETLNGRLLDSRPVRIDLARPKEPRPKPTSQSPRPDALSPAAPSNRQPQPSLRPAGAKRSMDASEHDRRGRRPRDQERRRKLERPRRDKRSDKYFLEDEDEF
ncbi:MAG: RNA-binding protein [Anaerolineae bacterium]|nr:RNA-binding protein [Thermoflexales bacterium]MDW8395231.1 RNA-binding protein [Anaerolineae bacterium]